MKSYKSLSSKYLKVQKRRTILTIIGIILSVSLISGVQVLFASFMDYQERENRERADYHGYFADIDYDKAIKIKDYVDIKEAVYMKNEGLTYIVIDKASFMEKTDDALFERGHGKKISALRVKGLDDKGFNRFKIELLQGRLPENSEEIVLRARTIKLLNGVKVGDKINILFGTKIDEEGNELLENHGSENDRFAPKVERTYKVVGIVKDNWIYSGDSELAFTALKGDMSGDYNVFIDVKNPRNTYKIAEKIGKSFGLSKDEGYRFQGNENILLFYGGSRNKEDNLPILLMISLITGIIVISTIAVIYNSFNISTIEKSSEYGMLRAVGASPKQIRDLVLREATLMSLIAIPLGIIGGFIGIKLLLSIFGMLNYNILNKIDLRIIAKPSIFITSIMVSTVTVYISAAIPAKRAGRVSPIEALKRVDRNIRIKKSKRAGIMKLIFGAEGEIAYKNLSRNKKRFVITVFSLALSVTLYIAFDSLVSQISYVTKSQLQKYDYSINTGNMDRNQSILKELNSIENVEKTIGSTEVFTASVVPENRIIKKNIWWVDSPRNDKSLVLYNSRVKAMDQDYINSLSGHMLEGKLDMSQLDGGGIILLQKNIKHIDNKIEYLDYTSYKVGDYVEFADISRGEMGINEELEKDELKKAKVIGVINDMPILNDFPNEGLYMITTENGLKSLNMKSRNSLIYVIKKPNTDGSMIVKYINKLKENGDIDYFSDIEARAEENRQILITMGILIYGFITLIILISSVNIFNTISSNLYTRKKELGVIKSVGMSQSSLRKMIYLEGFYYGLFAIIYGGLAGTGLAYLFYKIFDISQNVKWSVSIKSLVAASLGVMLITTLSTYLPLRKLNTTSIIESIRNEE